MRQAQLWTGMLLGLGSGLMLAPITFAQPTDLTQTVFETEKKLPTTGRLAADSTPVILPQINLEISKSQPVEVLVVGAQPTQKLRLQPRVGSQQNLNLTWQIQNQISLGDQMISAGSIPRIKVQVRTTVTAVQLNGQIHYRATYHKVEVDPSGAPQPVVEFIQRQMTAIEGLTTDYVITRLGEPQSVTMSFPEAGSNLQRSLLTQFTQSVNHLSAPLPEMSIGIGSQWQQTIPVQINGTTLQQTTLYKLSELKNGVATIDFELTQTVQPQTEIEQPPSGELLQIKSLQSMGSGQFTWDLQQLLPQRSHIKLTSDVIGQPQANNPEQATPVLRSRSRLDMQATSNIRPQAEPTPATVSSPVTSKSSTD